MWIFSTLRRHLLKSRFYLQASGAEHSFKAHFQDLVELMVGWSFEPKLTETQRSCIFSTLASFGAVWKERQQFGAQLLSSLVVDAQKTGSREASEPPSKEEHYSLLAYIGCSTALVEACGMKASGDTQGEYCLLICVWSLTSAYMARFRLSLLSMTLGLLSLTNCRLPLILG